MHSNNLFSVKIAHSKDSTNIQMDMTIPIVNTKVLPLTSNILNSYLPSIFYSKCFNERNQSFKREVQRTEIGHLFEHIILEYLFLIKESRGSKNVVHNGLTHWNWTEDYHGVFHIDIDCAQKDKEVFYEALTKSINLTMLILASKDFGVEKKNKYLQVKYLQ